MIELPAGSTTHNVKIYEIVEVPSTREGGSPAHRLRWKVAGRPRPNSASYQRRGQATARASELRAAMSKGIAFHVGTGLPVTEYIAHMEAEAARAADAVRAARPVWFEHATAFAMMKWPGSSPGHRRNLLDALATVTPAFFTTRQGRPQAGLLRTAMYSWAFHPIRRYTRTGDGLLVENDPPDHLADAVAWLAANTLLVEQIDASAARVAADLLTRKIDGTGAAASTVIRRRSALYSALDYAAERKLLAGNPLDGLKWVRPKTTSQIDRRCVVNHTQARALLDAVAEVDGGRYRRLKIFFGCMYYSALRPEEVNGLEKADILLPGGKDPDGWGEFLLDVADPDIGGQWTDSGEREKRGLKHRADTDTRPVPIPPPLVRMIRDHVSEFGWSDDHLVRGVRGGPVPGSVYGQAFHSARAAAFTAEQARSPLAARPYDLRHACLSGWLNAGVPATQVAEWAGHSLQMLLTIYAKCVDGQGAAARKRIAAALGEDLASAPADTASTSGDDDA